jgi:hypothetical protein
MGLVEGLLDVEEGSKIVGEGEIRHNSQRSMVNGQRLAGNC